MQPIPAIGIVLTAVLSAAPSSPSEPVADVRLTDAAGKPWSLHRPAAKAVVLFFVWPDCPASNAYAPEMKRLAESFGEKGVAVSGVHCDPDLTAAQALRHAEEHGLPFPMVLDPGQKLAAAVGADRVPAAAVLSSAGRVLYVGRIDDRYVSLGRRRPEPTRRDLAEAVAEVLAGRSPGVARTEAVGCRLPKLPPAGK